MAERRRDPASPESAARTAAVQKKRSGISRRLGFPSTRAVEVAGAKKKRYGEDECSEESCA